MPSGRIKWFNATKGYGFIQSEASCEDIFVHFSELQMEGFKTVRESMDVTFDLDLTGKGPMARQVRLAGQEACSASKAPVNDGAPA
jgi:CspA family cold shock protein